MISIALRGIGLGPGEAKNPVDPDRPSPGSLALRSIMRIFRPLILIATAALALAALVLAPTLIEAAPRSPVNGRVAIHGYDPVAYFVEGGPRKGRSELAVERNGARWLFSSVANRARFEADPDRGGLRHRPLDLRALRHGASDRRAARLPRLHPARLGLLRRSYHLRSRRRRRGQVARGDGLIAG